MDQPWWPTIFCTTKKKKKKEKLNPPLNYNILNINNTFGNVLKATPVITLRKNTLLRQIVGENTIRDNQKLLKIKQKGECISPYHTSQ